MVSLSVFDASLGVLVDGQRGSAGSLSRARGRSLRRKLRTEAQLQVFERLAHGPY
jgi:hypothetical protein